MDKNERRPRRRKDSPFPPIAPLGMAAMAMERMQRAHAAHADGAPADLVERLALEAIGYMHAEVSRYLISPAPHDAVKRDRSGWLRGLRRLAYVDVLSDDLNGLALALSELDRGMQSDRLVATGKSIASAPRGGGASTDKMRLMAIAVQAFEAFRNGRPKNKAAREAEQEADARGIENFEYQRIKEWSRALKQASPEVRATWLVGVRMDEAGRPADVLGILFKAFAAVKGTK